MEHKATTKPAFADSIATMFDQYYNASKYANVFKHMYTWNHQVDMATWPQDTKE